MSLHSWIWVLLLVVIAGAWMGSLIQIDPGYVLLIWHNTSIEMSLWSWLVLMMLAYAALFIYLRLLRILNSSRHTMSRWANDGQQKRLQLRMRHGLLALANGQYKRAVAKLSSLPQNVQPLVVVPALAQAQARLGQYNQALHCLDKLAKNMPDTQILVWMAQARILLEKGDTEAALQPLYNITTTDKHHVQANEMLLKLLQDLQRWQAVIELLQMIEVGKLMTTEVSEQQQQAYQQAFIQQVDNKSALANLQQLWNHAPTAVKQSKRCRLTWVQVMQKAEGEPAEHTAAFIEHNLQHQWDDDLVLVYGRLPMVNLQHALQGAEAWQKQAKNSAALQLALGCLCRRLALRGKARDYLQYSIKLQPSKAAYIEMAGLQQQLGDINSALENYRCANLY